MEARASGLIVVVSGEVRFISSAYATRVVPRPPVSPVPGAPLGIALVDGVVVPVIEVGDDPDELLLCQVDGELVALAGLRVLEAGFFDAPDGVVERGGEGIRSLDVVAELQRLEQQVAARRTGAGPCSG